MNSLALQLEFGTKIIIDAVETGNLGLYVKIFSKDLEMPIEFKNIRYEAFEKSKLDGKLEMLDQKKLTRADLRKYLWQSGKAEEKFVEERIYKFEADNFTSSYSIVKGLWES